MQLYLFDNNQLQCHIILGNHVPFKHTRFVLEVVRVALNHILITYVYEQSYQLINIGGSLGIFERQMTTLDIKVWTVFRYTVQTSYIKVKENTHCAFMSPCSTVQPRGNVALA